MVTQELEKRKERVANETMVISKVEGGFQVFAPSDPTNSYVVSGTADAPRCSCPDFQYHTGEREWRCRHILAALGQLYKSQLDASKSSLQGSTTPNVPSEPTPQNGRETPQGQDDQSAQMLIKRSVSPDGRIDSLSVEFSCPVEKIPVGEIKSRAQKTLALQSEIIEVFMESHKNSGNGKEKKSEPTNFPDCATPARLLSIGGLDGKWGRRLFISVQSNGSTLKHFGSVKQLEEAIASAGFPQYAGGLFEGKQLNLPCRIIVKPSRDGKYLNVEQILPWELLAEQRRAQ